MRDTESLLNVAFDRFGGFDLEDSTAVYSTLRYDQPGDEPDVTVHVNYSHGAFTSALRELDGSYATNTRKPRPWHHPACLSGRNQPAKQITLSKLTRGHAAGFWKSATCCTSLVAQDPVFQRARVDSAYSQLLELVGGYRASAVMELEQCGPGELAANERRRILYLCRQLLTAALETPVVEDQSLVSQVRIASYLLSHTCIPQPIPERAARREVLARAYLMSSSAPLPGLSTSGMYAPVYRTWRTALGPRVGSTPFTVDAFWSEFIEGASRGEDLELLCAQLVARWDYTAFSLSSIDQLPQMEEVTAPPVGMDLHSWLAALWSDAMKDWVLGYTSSVVRRWQELAQLAVLAGDVVLEYQPESLTPRTLELLTACDDFDVCVGEHSYTTTVPAAVGAALLAASAETSERVRIVAIPGLAKSAVADLRRVWSPIPRGGGSAEVEDDSVEAMASTSLLRALAMLRLSHS